MPGIAECVVSAGPCIQLQWSQFPNGSINLSIRLTPDALRGCERPRLFNKNTSKTEIARYRSDFLREIIAQIGFKSNQGKERSWAYRENKPNKAIRAKTIRVGTTRATRTTTRAMRTTTRARTITMQVDYKMDLTVQTRHRVMGRSNLAKLVANCVKSWKKDGKSVETKSANSILYGRNALGSST
jgi:hypothetical protein